MRETHLLALQKKEKLFLALSLAAVVLCTVLAFGFAVPLQAAGYDRAGTVCAGGSEHC